MNLRQRKIVATEISKEIIKNPKIENIKNEIKSLSIMDIIKIIGMVIAIIKKLVKG